MRKYFLPIKAGSVVTFLLFLILLICSCQQTPDHTPVVYGGGLEKSIEGSPAPFGAYNAPTSWQEALDIKGRDTKLDINASISVPVMAYPIYKVKRATFSDARIASLAAYFSEGKDVVKESVSTKAELEEQLVLAKKNNDEESWRN